MKKSACSVDILILILIRILFVTLKSPHVQNWMPFWILFNGPSQNGCATYV